MLGANATLTTQSCLRVRVYFVYLNLYFNLFRCAPGAARQLILRQKAQDRLALPPLYHLL